MQFPLFFMGVFFITVASLSAESDKLHPKKLNQQQPADFSFESELQRSGDYWMDKGQSILKDLLGRKNNDNHAKNVIMFLGDGMGFSTVAATRMYMGDEDVNLSFEKFPHVGFSKTYCVDAQVADSACTATSYLSAVKTNYEVVGLNAKAKLKDCDAQIEENFTESIASWAQKAGKGTGVVTTTRITHASPAGVYAHAAFREWENDHEMSLHGCDASKLDDIAEQLVYSNEGKNLKVILGGGRANFRNQTMTDEEGRKGFRTDGKDLIEEWKKERSKMGKAAYVFDRNGLRNIDFQETDYVLGLFEHDHMKYNLEVVNQNLEHQEPTLTEMTVAAIKMLQKEENGYFLFVEGGMIDQAHHYNLPRLSLDESKEFSKAVEAARFMTDESDTLIVVTADHSHAFTFNGYPSRGTDIFGNAEVSDEDSLPYTTLSYANGPGFATTYNEDGSRVNPQVSYDTTNPRQAYPATVPRDKETHGGEDVGVWASGPMAHLFRGSYDQTSIPMIMAYILQVGPYETGASWKFGPFVMLLVSMLVMLKIVK